MCSVHSTSTNETRERLCKSEQKRRECVENDKMPTPSIDLRVEKRASASKALPKM